MGPFSSTCFRITTGTAPGSRQMEQRTIQVPLHHLSLNMQCMNQLGKKITSVTRLDGNILLETQKVSSSAMATKKASAGKETKQTTKKSRRKSKP
jgi:hypothetical protein